MTESTRKLKLGALVALVVGSMIGGGIFSLPQNIAASASAGATLVGPHRHRCDAQPVGGVRGAVARLR